MSALAWIAVALLCMGLGARWSLDSGEVYVPGFYTAGGCYTDSSGWWSCSPGYLSPGHVAAADGAPIPRYLSPVRVMLVGAIAVVFVGMWRRDRRAFAVSGLLAAAAVLLYGTQLGAGPLLVAVAGAVLLLIWRTTQQEPSRGIDRPCRS